MKRSEFEKALEGCIKAVLDECYPPSADISTVNKIISDVDLVQLDEDDELPWYIMGLYEGYAIGREKTLNSLDLEG